MSWTHVLHINHIRHISAQSNLTKYDFQSFRIKIILGSGVTFKDNKSNIDPQPDVWDMFQYVVL